MASEKEIIMKCDSFMPGPIADLIKFIDTKAGTNVLYNNIKMPREQAIARIATRIAFAAIALTVISYTAIEATFPLVTLALFISTPAIWIAGGSYFFISGMAIAINGLALGIFAECGIGVATALAGYACINNYKVFQIYMGEDALLYLFGY